MFEPVGFLYLLPPWEADQFRSVPLSRPISTKRLSARGFKPRIVKEADGAASALAFVAAGFGVAVVSEPLQKIPAKDVIFRKLPPEDSAWVSVGAAWKPDAVSAPVVSRFVDTLVQICTKPNGEHGVPRSKTSQPGSNLPLAEV